MIIKYYNSYTSTTRFKTSLNFTDLIKKKLERKLIIKYNFSHGRNNQGKITCRHKGGGHKRKYRIIDFKRNKYNILGKVIALEYDPNRNVNIALIYYKDGEKKYILHPLNLNIGDYICSGNSIELKIGNTLPLEKIPLGTNVHNIELIPTKGGQLIRSAGTFAKILAKEKNYVILKLPSNEIRILSKKCTATIGRLSNLDVYNIKLGKAGRSRWLGIRPCVRGSAMNPIDHPHGGGNGKSPIGKKYPVTPWGKPTLGFKTRKKKNKTNIFILKKNI